MIRDEELNRLIRYAQGMGLSVRFMPYVRGSDVSAEWHNDGSQITIYTTSRCSKLEKILSLIHELGHHKAFVNNDREVDPKIDEALDSEEKRHRKRVWNMEIHDSKYWEEIYRDTNCQFGLDRLEMQRELDIWRYEFLYENDREASIKERRAKKKELKKKYRC